MDTMHKEWYEYPTNLVDMLEDSIKKFPDRPSIGMKKSNRDYEYITYKELGKRIDDLRGGLANFGVKNGDSVGLIINNSIEWAIIAFAAFGLGARLVPMYEKELENTWKYIVSDSNIKILFVVNDAVHQKVAKWLNELETLEKIFIIRGNGENTMAALEHIGQDHPIPSIKPHWSDIASLIYTSGTTGEPKGVLLSHGNFTTNVQAAKKRFPDADENTVSLSILPWAHSFGQTGELYLGLYIGGSAGIMESMNTIVEDMEKVRPTLLIAVPRVFNRVYNSIHSMMCEKGGLKEKLFHIAKDAAKKKRETGKSSLKLKLLDKILFQKIRNLFGGRLEFAITGSAATNPEVAQFFIDIGIPTYDCYGLTETTPGITMNCPSANRLGSVGRPIEKVTVIIDTSCVDDDSEDGEIICYGPNVMQGYHNKPDATAAVIVNDPVLGPGFRTGDRGKLDKDGYLFITGRFKEAYKLENGKYVHPVSLEEEIKLNPYVANAFVYGDGKPYNIGLIVPDFTMLKKQATAMGIPMEDPETLAQNKQIIDFLASEVTRQLKGRYGGYEIPKKFIVVTEDFSLENGMLTQTMKVKRRNVLQAYGERVLSLYDD